MNPDGEGHTTQEGVRKHSHIKGADHLKIGVIPKTRIPVGISLPPPESLEFQELIKRFSGVLSLGPHTPFSPNHISSIMYLFFSGDDTGL